MAAPARSTEAFLYYWGWWQARGCGGGRGGSEREAATLRDEMSERFQQGVARWAGAGAAGRFYSTSVLSALINN